MNTGRECRNKSYGNDRFLTFNDSCCVFSSSFKNVVFLIHCFTKKCSYLIH